MSAEPIKSLPTNVPERNSVEASSVATDDALQTHLLAGVSRTFALTIPRLPSELARVVTNAYLLCRIVDTVEDEPALNLEQKRRFCEQFAEVVSARAPSERFAVELAPLLSESTLPTEHELIRNVPRVIRVTHGFDRPRREALECCVREMARGMAEFQENSNLDGLEDLHDLDRYCYYVAGVVGIMLTKLFCEHSPDVARNREALMRHAISFGQGLQMTNILKDIWDDRRRGACWLPRKVFEEVGFDLRKLRPGQYQDGFGRGLAHLIGIAHAHLQNALTYTLLIPKHESGIRNFCLWAIGMAVLTLRKINKHRDFSCGNQVKISRRSVKVTVLTSRLTAPHDRMLQSLFYLAGTGLPDAKIQ